MAAVKQSEQVMEYVKKGSFTLDEIATHTGIKKPCVNVYLWKFRKSGEVVRSGERGSYRFSAGGGAGEVSKPEGDYDAWSESGAGASGGEGTSAAGSGEG